LTQYSLHIILHALPLLVVVQCAPLSALHVTRLEQNTALNAETEEFITAKISGNAWNQRSRTHSVLRQGSSQLQKHKKICFICFRSVPLDRMFPAILQRNNGNFTCFRSVPLEKTFLGIPQRNNGNYLCFDSVPLDKIFLATSREKRWGPEARLKRGPLMTSSYSANRDKHCWSS